MIETSKMHAEQQYGKKKKQGTDRRLLPRVRGRLRLFLLAFFCLFLLFPSSLHAALVNGDFSDGMTGWDVTQGVYVGDGVNDGIAVLIEDENVNPVSLVQTFTMPPDTFALSFSISASLVDNGGENPPDAVQVSLFDDAGDSMVGSISDFPPGAVLSIQQSGEIYYVSEINISGAPASGSTWTAMPGTIIVTVTLPAITDETSAKIAFDFIHYGGDQTSSVRIDDVRTLVAPVAADDAATIIEDTPTVISVLDNDSDPDGPDGKPDPLTSTITIETGPSHGTAEVQNDGTVTILYTPTQNYYGGDSFTYTVIDNTGVSSNIATVSLTITNVNDPPVANADEATVTEDTPTAIDVLTNDTDPDVQYGGGAPDSSTLAIVSVPTYGTADVVDGKINYNPLSDYFGSDSFTYTVADDTGAVSNEATVILTITNVNDPPVANADEATVTEDTPTAIDVLDNDLDPDNPDGKPDPQTSTLTIESDPSHGTAVVQGDGTILYTPVLNYFGTDGFTYAVTDDSDAVSNVAEVSLTITNVNDPPVATDDEATVTEDTPTGIDVLDNDSDPDDPGEKPDPQTSPLTVETGPIHGTATVQGDGTILYSPALNYFGTDSFTYTVADNDGAVSNIAGVSLTITNVNDTPVAMDDVATVTEDNEKGIDVLDNDLDPDNPGGKPDTQTSILTVETGPSHGTADMQGDGTILYTPALNYFGTDSFTYTVADDSDAVSNVAGVSLTITNVNDPPVAADDVATVTEDIPTFIDVLDNDTDPDFPNGGGPDSSTLAVETGPSHGTAAVQGDGTILYTPVLDYFGPDSFTYTVADDDGVVSNVAEVSLTITNVNDSPIAAAGVDQAVIEGFQVVLDGSQSSDVENSELGYAWSQTGGPVITLLDSDAMNPTFIAPYVGAQGALLVFQLEVRDSGELTGTDLVSIRIADVVRSCDVNDDHRVDLADSVLMLRVLSGLPVSGDLSVEADVNGDDQLGTPEAICAFQTAAEIGYDSDHDGDGFTPAQGDCNDGNPEIHPNTVETCNGMDDNCNGLIDEDLPPGATYYRDFDDDGYGDPAAPFQSCAQPNGYVTDKTDSDDTDSASH